MTDHGQARIEKPDSRVIYISNLNELVLWKHTSTTLCASCGNTEVLILVTWDIDYFFKLHCWFNLDLKVPCRMSVPMSLHLLTSIVDVLFVLNKNSSSSQFNHELKVSVLSLFRSKSMNSDSSIDILPNRYKSITVTTTETGTPFWNYA